MFLPIDINRKQVLHDFELCLMLSLRAQSFAERLRLGIAVIHGEAQDAESDLVDGRHSPPMVRSVGAIHPSLEIPSKCSGPSLLFSSFVFKADLIFSFSNVNYLFCFLNWQKLIKSHTTAKAPFLLPGDSPV